MQRLATAFTLALYACLTPCVTSGLSERADLTAEDLKGLILADVPGLRAQVRKDGTTGPWIDRQPSAGSGRISGVWVSGDNLNRLAVAVLVHPDVSSARAALVNWRRQRAAVYYQDADEARIGDESWARTHPLAAVYVVFRAGRVVASVGLGPYGRRPSDSAGPDGRVLSVLDHRLEDEVRALARSLVVAIRRNPNMLAARDNERDSMVAVAGKPTVQTSASTFHDGVWAPLSAFAAAGATVVWDARSGTAAVTYRANRLELQALRRTARVNGQEVDLGFAGMVGPSGPIVPLRKIAELLGMKVRATKTTIEIG